MDPGAFVGLLMILGCFGFRSAGYVCGWHDVLPGAPRSMEQGMSEDRTTRWLSLTANLGAIVGLVFVGLQLQQSRDLTRAQVRHELTMGIVEIQNNLAGNAQLASLWRRARIGEELSPDEQVQFETRSNALFRYWENVHYQYLQGLYDESEYLAQREAWRAAFRRHKGFASYWCKNSSFYSPRFASELNGLLENGQCPSDQRTGRTGHSVVPTNRGDTARDL